MRKGIFLLLFSILALTGCEINKNFYPVTFKKISYEVELNSNAFQIAKDIFTNSGDRLPGSIGGQLAEEIVYLLMRTIGCNDVHFQKVFFDDWSSSEHSLAIGKSSSRCDSIVECSIHTYSASGDVTGEIVPFNSIDPDSLLIMDLTDKIVLLPLEHHSDTIQFKSLPYVVAVLSQAGASGVITISEKDEALTTQSVTYNSIFSPIPVLNITHNTGTQILSQLTTNKLYAHIVSETISGEGIARNIIASLPGKELKDEHIVVCAHLDNYPGSQGIADDCAGVAALLDIARCFKSLKLKNKRSIDFVVLAAGTKGNAGAYAFCDEISEIVQPTNIRYVINLDNLSVVSGTNLMGRFESEEMLRQIGNIVASTDSLYSNKIVNDIDISADSTPFILKGIPVLAFFCKNEMSSCQGYNDDTLQKLNEDELKNTVKYGAMYLFALANDNSLPTSFLTDEQQENYYRDNHIEPEINFIQNR